MDQSDNGESRCDIFRGTNQNSPKNNHHILRKGPLQVYLSYELLLDKQYLHVQ